MDQREIDCLDNITRVIHHILNGQLPDTIPLEGPGTDEIRQLCEYVNRLAAELKSASAFTRELSIGRLSEEFKSKLALSGHLRNLQAGLRHLTWQAGQVTRGDFSQRVSFMGEFSTSFNLMVQELAANQEVYQERLRSAMKATGQGWFDLNVKTAEICVSREYAAIIGYGPEELRLRLRDWMDAIHPEDRAAVSDAYEESLNSAGALSIEYRWRTKTGEWKWTRSVGKVVGFDAGAKPLRMSGTHADISQIKLAEAALRESEEFHRTLIGLLPDAIFVADRDGLLTFASPGARQMFGYPPEEEILGGGLLDRVVPEERRKAVEGIGLLLGQGAFKGDEFTFARGDGTLFVGEVHAALIRPSDDSPGKIMVIVHDITDRKRVEGERRKLQMQLHQAQKLESIGRLAGGVAHDFNNMLGVILGHTEMILRRTDPGDERYAPLQEIYKAGDRSADLTRQLLAFARKQVVEPKLLDLNDTISGMIKMLQRLIGEHIDLVWRPGYRIWKVKIDPSQMDQILANLAVNARDAINGTGKVTIETSNIVIEGPDFGILQESAPGEYVLLAVSDNGIGMNKEVVDHIFEPFFTTKDFGKGAGLGLATVYGIVKQNQGFVKVYSEPDHGAVFRVYLPGFKGETGRPGTEICEAKPPGGAETVLIVEDEEAILNLGKLILERQGYTVLTVSKPTEAVRLVEEYTGDIDLLITDVIMPEMNGRELADRVTALKPGLRCLYMSGYTADVIAQHGIVEEGVDFIEKPFSVRAMAEKVREILDR